MTGIYCFKNLINQKVYIGQAVDIQKRYEQHLRNINNPKHQETFYRALRKYGIDNFSFEVLQQCSIDELSDLEIRYIDKYNAYFDGGYNETKGGEGCLGYKHNQEAKEKMSRARKGRIFDELWKQHLRENSSHHTAWNNGKNLSEEHKEKISKGLEGHKHTEYSKQKMSENSTHKKAVLCDGIRFDSVTDCANFYNVKFSVMRSWLDGMSYTPTEFFLKGLQYADKDPHYSIIISPIKQVVCEGVLYNNISQCAKFYGVDRKIMSKWLNDYLPMPLDFITKGLRFENKTYYKSNPKIKF